MKPNGKTIGIDWASISLLTLIILFAYATMPTITHAVPPSDMKTLYVIADIDEDANDECPLQAWLIVDDELIFAQTWMTPDKDWGPVGLAIDDANENLFLSYEQGYVIEIFDARTASPISWKSLSGTDDLAGMVVHQTNNELYVVDRDEPDIFVFDSTTFQLLDQWVLNDGAWGIDLLGDILYVGSHTNTVRYYDINSNSEVGSYTISTEAVGIAVTSQPFRAAFHTGFDAHNDLVKYELDTGIEQVIDVGGGYSKGVSLNPATGYVYAVGGEYLKVYDMATLTLQNTYNIGFGRAPTDILTSTIDFGGSVSKQCTSHPTGSMFLDEDVTFTITIENRDISPIHEMALQDTYDTNDLVYVDADAPYPSDDNVDDGIIDWADLIAQRGTDLQPGASMTLTTNFKAIPEGCVDFADGQNIAKIHDVYNAETPPRKLPDAASAFSYSIDCHCQSDLMCDDGQWCNGAEICNVDGFCEAGDIPCPDDGLYCNGQETCDENSQSCDSTGDPCNDGVFCNGEETCAEGDQQAECSTGENPCADDGDFCNGEEACDEEGQTCTHSGDPCDDGIYCNGEEACDANAKTCIPSTGNPCSDDGQFCNGYEQCDEEHQECLHSGDPCVDPEVCNEELDLCEVELVEEEEPLLQVRGGCGG